MQKPISAEAAQAHDADNPLWTRERMIKAARFDDLPASLRGKLAAIQETSRKTRGAQKTPTKQSVTIRLSPDVLAALRGKGRGWQALVDQALREKFLNLKA